MADAAAPALRNAARRASALVEGLGRAGASVAKHHASVSLAAEQASDELRRIRLSSSSSSSSSPCQSSSYMDATATAVHIPTYEELLNEVHHILVFVQLVYLKDPLGAYQRIENYHSWFLNGRAKRALGKTSCSAALKDHATTKRKRSRPKSNDLKQQGANREARCSTPLLGNADPRIILIQAVTLCMLGRYPRARQLFELLHTWAVDKDSEARMRALSITPSDARHCIGYVHSFFLLLTKAEEEGMKNGSKGVGEGKRAPPLLSPDILASVASLCHGHPSATCKGGGLSSLLSNNRKKNTATSLWGDTGKIPGFTQSSFLLGFLKYCSGDYPAAARCYSYSASKAFRPTASLNQLGCAQAAQGEFHRSLQYLKQAVASVHRMQNGASSSLKGKVRDASVDARKACYNAAVLFARKRNYRSVAETLRRLDSMSAGRTARETTNSVNGRLRLTLKNPGSITAQNPSRRKLPRHVLAQTLLALGQEREAEKEYEDLIISDQDVMEGGGGILSDGRHSDEGQDLPLSLYTEYTDILLSRGKIFEAFEWNRHCIRGRQVHAVEGEYSVDDVKLLLQFSEVRMRTGRPVEAREGFFQAASMTRLIRSRHKHRASGSKNLNAMLDRLLVQSLNNFALASVILTNIEDAIRALKEAYKIRPASHQVAFNLTSLLLRKESSLRFKGIGENTKATPTLASALITWMNFRRIYLHSEASMYEVELKQRKKEKARLLLKSALHTTYFRTDPSEIQALVLDCIVLEAWIQIRADASFAKALKSVRPPQPMI